MPVDFSLLNQRPITANITPMADIDPNKKALEQTNLDTQNLKLTEEKDAYAQQKTDQQHIQDYLTNGGDFNTPDGTAKALNDLKGKVSYPMYEKLSQHAQDLKMADVKLRTDAMQYDEDKIKSYSAQHEVSQQVLGNLQEQYNQVLSEKGKPAADAAFPEMRNQAVANLQSAGIQNPELIKGVSSIIPEAIPGAIKGSQYAKSVAEDTWKAAQAKESESKAAAQTAAGKAKPMVDEAGNRWVVAGNDIWMNGVKMPPETKVPKLTRIDAPPDHPTQLKEGTKALLAEPTQGLLDMAVDHAITGKSPPLGNSAGPMRIAEAQLAAALKNTPEGAAVAVDYKRDSTSLANLTKVADTIATGEKTAEQLITLLEPYQQSGKLNPTGIKKVNEWINNFRKNILGDADLTSVDIYDNALKSDISRVLAGQTGASATPVQFQKDGSIVVQPGLSPAQYAETMKTVAKDMQARLTAQGGQIDTVRQRILESRKKLVQIAVKASETVDSTDLSNYGSQFNDTKIAPSAQKAADSDALKILKPEVDKAAAAYASAKDDVSKTRALEDVKASAREYAKSGGSFTPYKSGMKIQQGVYLIGGKPYFYKGGAVGQQGNWELIDGK